MMTIFLIYARTKFHRLLYISRLKMQMQMWEILLKGTWGRRCRNLDRIGKRVMELLVEVLMV